MPKAGIIIGTAVVGHLAIIEEHHCGAHIVLDNAAWIVHQIVARTMFAELNHTLDHILHVGLNGGQHTLDEIVLKLFRNPLNCAICDEHFLNEFRIEIR